MEIGMVNEQLPYRKRLLWVVGIAISIFSVGLHLVLFWLLSKIQIVPFPNLKNWREVSIRLGSSKKIQIQSKQKQIIRSVIIPKIPIEKLEPIPEIKALLKPPPKLEELLKPPPQITPHEKMVDQNEFEDEKENPEARFLGQKNHRTQQERQAKNQNAEKSAELNQQEPQRSTMIPKQVKEAEENQKENQKNTPRTEAEKLPRSSIVKTEPQKLKNQFISQKTKKPGSQKSHVNQEELSPLAMRSKEEPSKESTLDSQKVNTQNNENHKQESFTESKNGEKPGKPNLFIQSPLDYEKIVGKTQAAEERQMARQIAKSGQQEKSSSSEKWEKKQSQRVAAALGFPNNHIPNMEVGNENELSTRKHPFAAYLAGVHRNIHEKWGDGFLANLDRNGSGNYSLSLTTQVAIIINADGTLCRHRVVAHSGNSAFDVAAWHSVLSAAPFMPPPESIQSPDGKVYVIWSFFRDHRQCATDFVHAQILTKTDNAPCEAL